MKKLLAILLLSLLLYNMMGYYLIFVARQYQARQTMIKFLESTQKIDNQVFVVKIPVSLPYQIDWEDYQYMRGSFEYEGKFYEKVKQILLQDTMYVYCLENEKQAQLHSELSQHTQMHLLDFSKNQTNKSEKTHYNFIKEYLPLQPYSFSLNVQFVKKQTRHSLTFNVLPSSLDILSPPPKRA